MAIEDFFYSTVDLEQPTLAKDDILGRTHSWTAIHTAVRACIQPRAATEARIAGREAVRTTHVMYVRHSDISSSLPAEDWRVIATAGPSDGTYNIQAVRNIDEIGEFLTIAMDEVE